MWMWVLALLGTLVAFGLAWRGIARAEGATARVRSQLDGLEAVAVARAELDDATRASAGERVRLHTRLGET